MDIEPLEKPDFTGFEKRKQEHISLSLEPESEALGRAGLNHIRLEHEAFPELNFDEVDLTSEIFGNIVSSPFFVSCMTAGHSHSTNINRNLALACEIKKWPMGVGSQRRQLTDEGAAEECRELRRLAPDNIFLGNIGIAQLIESPVSEIQKMVDSLKADAMVVHTNPLQECFQPEGTPQFRGGLKALENLISKIDVPVVVKETGCGFSRSTLESLANIGVRYVDVSGLGGTHWGRIEGARAGKGSEKKQASETFQNWGISTVESVLNATPFKGQISVWASGGVRTGLDAAKLLALGAERVGFAKPMLEGAMQGVEVLVKKMNLLEFELKTAMFCTGSRNLRELQRKQKWQWQRM